MSEIINKGIIKAGSLLKLNERINYFKAAPEAMENMMRQEKYIKRNNVELASLIKLFISKINGCSYCIEMHYKESIQDKESIDRIESILSLNYSNNLFNEKEKMIFKFVEKVTLISENDIDEQLYDDVKKLINDKEYINLIVLINQVNSWNRLSKACGNHAKKIR